MLFLLLPLQLFNDPYSTIIYDKDGKLFAARIAEDGQWRFPPVDSVPYKYKTALLEFEDRNFYHHPGFNPISLFRAAVQNYRSGKIVSGGSTISMQVIRLAGKGRKRTYPEKVREIALAIKLETRNSKDEILAHYASHAPFGGNVVGLDAAAWRYFGRSPHELSWAEAATLAVLPNAPSLIHPGKNRETLLSKRNRLLDRLYHKGKIDSLSCMLAKLENIPDKPEPLPQKSIHLLDRVLAKKPGRGIHTTLDGTLQDKVDRIVNRHQGILAQNEIHNAAALVLDTESGDILAYIGNTKNNSDRHGSYVDVILAPRSYGSILKPFLYAAMLDDGMILPNTLVPDIPTYLSGYTPKNFDLGYQGAIQASGALARSLNVPTVRMLRKYGAGRFHTLLTKTGMTTLTQPPSHYGLSLILGGAEGSLLEISGMYASLARQLIHFYDLNGKYDPGDIRAPNFYTDSSTRFNSASDIKLKDNSPFSAGAGWLTFEALLKVNRPEEELGWEHFTSSGKIAWKTGTSFGFRDGWAIGVNPRYTVGIWVGNADGEGRPGLIGVSIAAPIMFDIFNILPDSPWFEPPHDELVEIPVCRESGHRVSAHCPEHDTILVLQQGLKTEPCPYHQIIHLDSTRKWRLDVACAGSSGIIHKPWFILPPVQQWYYRSYHPSYKKLPPFHPGCTQETGQNTLAFIYPEQNARIYVPIELDGSPGSVVLEIAHMDSRKEVFWHLDDHYLGRTSHFHQMEVRPDKGMHSVIVVDEDGNEAIVRFEILSEISR